MDTHNPAELSQNQDAVETQPAPAAEQAADADTAGVRSTHSGILPDGPANDLSPENTSLFGEMSAAGKIVYEGMMKIPVVNERLANFMMERKQKSLYKWNQKTHDVGEKIKGLDKKIADANQEENEGEEGGGGGIRGMINALKAERRPGNIAHWEAEKARLYAKAEANKEKAQGYEGERDEIANWLIGRYDEKMRPLETKLAAAESEMADFRERNAGDLTRYRELETQYEGARRAKARLVGGREEYTLSKAEKIQLASYKEQMKSADKEARRMKKLVGQKTGIEGKLNKAKAALQRRDKRPGWINAKNCKAFGLPPQAQAAEGQGERPDDAAQAEVNDQQNQAPVNETEQNPENRTYGIGDLLENWNTLISEKLGSNYNRMTIGIRQLQEELNLPENGSVNMEGFLGAIEDLYANSMDQGNWLRERITEAINEFPGRFSNRGPAAQ